MCARCYVIEGTDYCLRQGIPLYILKTHLSMLNHKIMCANEMNMCFQPQIREQM